MLIELHMSIMSYPMKWDTIVAMATRTLTYYIPLVRRLEELSTDQSPEPVWSNYSARAKL